MTNEEAAYIAGFLDGDGYITIRRANIKTCKNPCYRLVVGFTNKDLSVLTWIQGMWGGSLNPKWRRSDRHAPAFELVITSHGMIKGLLLLLLPYARIKEQQIRLGLNFLALGRVRMSSYARGKTWPLRIADAGEVNAREEMKLKLTDLNRRGPCPSSSKTN